MEFILKEIREDKEFVGRLESVAGIGPALSLLIEGYEKYHKFKFEELAYSQQAYFHLSKFVLEIAKDSVMDLEKGGQLQQDSANVILENIIKKVKDAESKPEYYSDSRDIAGLSIVRELRESIENSLRQAGAGKDIITEFYTNFNSLIDERSIRNEKARSFYQWLDRVIKEETILKHLERLEREFSGYTYSNVEPPLSRYYVEDQHAILDDFRRIEDTTVSIDENNNDIKATESEDKSAYDLVNEFLDESQQRFIIIGASFGVGKTSLCRYLAAKYARQCKEKPDLFGLDYYVPILVWLEESRNGLISMKSARSIADIINEIASGEGSNRARSERRILLILDGLDQYQGDQPLIDTINELCEEYKKLKVLITTRLEEKETAKKKLFGQNHLSSLDSYIRLLPFSKDQLNKFFQSYNDEASKTGIRRGGNSQLSRREEDEELFKDLLDIEELRRPFFAWIIAYIYNYDRSGLKEGLEALRKWGESMRNSWLFILFLYGRLDDKYSDSHVQDVDSYVKYKKVLRRVSFLKHIYGQNLSLETTEEELKKFGIIVDRDLFDHPPLMIRKVGKKLFVDFVNQSFQEYLFAEHILESALWNKEIMVYTTAPSRNTFLFLEGLIDVIVELGRNLSIGKFMVEGTRCWLKTIDDSAEGIEDLRYGLAPNISHFTSIRKFLQRVLSNNTFYLGKGSIRDRVDKVVSYYLDSWIRLYILNRLGLIEMTDINKEVLVDLIKIGNFLPGYIKSLNGVNLSEADLYGMNLRGAMLMGSNLEKSDLRCSILTGANLSSIRSLQSENYSSGKKGQESEKMLPKQQITKLSYANLNYAIVERARLEGADISGADLFFTNLLQAILPKANLSFANLHKSFLNDANLRETTLKGANLSSADLRGADLTNANLFLADFSGADLSNAILSGTNLSNANLSNANLSSVKLEDIKNFNGLICRGADFCNNATINQEGLLKHLELNGAKNLPRLASATALDARKKEESSLIINEPSTRKLKKKIDLTDVWNSKSGSKSLGIYYIHQVGETVWWLGQINGNTLNVFRGQIVSDNTIEGEWADVYSEDGKASFKQNRLKLTLDSVNDSLSYREENWKESKDVEGRIDANNDFDSIIWQRDKGWIIGIKDKTANKRSMFESQQQILTGIWSANDGGIYYIYQDEQNSNIWWFGVHNTDEPNFSNVFCGKIKDDQIEGEWADVPIGKTRNHGRLELRKVVEANKGLEKKLYLRRVRETGGFGTTAWERQKVE